MVLTMHGRRGTPQSTSQVLSVPTYIRKKALNPGRKIECTRAQMESSFQHGMWDLCWENGGNI